MSTISFAGVASKGDYVFLRGCPLGVSLREGYHQAYWPIIFHGNLSSRKHTVTVPDVFQQGIDHPVHDGLAQIHHFRNVDHSRFHVSGTPLAIGESCIEACYDEVGHSPLIHISDFSVLTNANTPYDVVLRTQMIGVLEESIWDSTPRSYRLYYPLCSELAIDMSYDWKGQFLGYQCRLLTECAPYWIDHSGDSLTISKSYRESWIRRKYSGKTLYTRSTDESFRKPTRDEAIAYYHMRLKQIAQERRKELDDFTANSKLDPCYQDSVSSYLKAAWFHPGSFSAQSFLNEAKDVLATVVSYENESLELIPWSDIAARAIANVSDQSFTGNGLSYLKDAASITGFARSLADVTTKITESLESLDSAFWKRYGKQVNRDLYSRSSTYRKSVDARISNARSDLVKGIADEYLSNHYGTKLTLIDTAELAESYNSTRFNGLYGLQRAQSEGTFERTVGDLKISRKARYCCYYKPKMTNNYMYEFLRNYDIEISLENLWDMVPYSFVVDWFVNASALAQEIDQDYRLKTAYDVVLREQSIKRTYTSDNWKMGLLNCQIDVQTYTRWYSDSAIEADWLSVVSLSTPSSHWLEGAALFVQHI